MKLFADLTDEQLAEFAAFLEPVEVRTNRIIVKIGEPGDAMYLIHRGEVRVSQLVENRETILAKLETGDFFGEFCLFGDGKRSADVVADNDCLLLKLSREGFLTVLEQHPATAARFLMAIIRFTESRLRSMNKKYVDSMLMASFWNRRK
jgi:SulP family sulfate permease